MPLANLSTIQDKYILDTYLKKVIKAVMPRGQDSQEAKY